MEKITNIAFTRNAAQTKKAENQSFQLLTSM